MAYSVLNLKICLNPWQTRVNLKSYCTHFLSCPTMLTGLYRTGSIFVPCSSEFTLLIGTKMACDYSINAHSANISTQFVERNFNTKV